MDRWEDDREKGFAQGAHFVCVCGGGREVLSLSFTGLSPDLSALRLHTMICRMPGI